jgi:hypothetical protein
VSVRSGWTLLVVGSSVLAVAAAAAGSGDGWSFLPLLWFLAVIPGLPYVRMAGAGGGPIGRWVGAVALSVAMDAVVAEVLLYTGSYGAARAVFVLAGIALLGEAFNLLRPTPAASDPAGHTAVPAGNGSDPAST